MGDPPTPGLLSTLWDPVAGTKVWEQLEASVNPSVLRSLVESPDSARAILNFLIFSPISLEKICKRPELLEWLSHPDVRNPKVTYRPSWRGDRSVQDLSFGELRAWKSQEMLRIGFREIAGLAGFAETTRDITAVAEHCVHEVYSTCFEHLAKRWGRPQTGFGILAMGKFGGIELNYSSDIDLIFFYGDEGFVNPRFSYHEFFTRLAEKIIQIFSAPGDSLFRIDVRLRPEGSHGPLVRSFDSMENYYAGYGETWERMALIKARGIAGDRELLYEFSQYLQPFIFPRTVSPDLLDEIAELKARIERDIVGAEDLHLNVKLGYGGIREVEFTLQTLQLLHGAKHAFLQERNTLKTLEALRQLQILPREHVHSLREAYIFLRAVEHRLQIQKEQQIHTLPSRTEAWLPIAWTFGYQSVKPFAEALRAHTAAVRSIFNRLLKSKGEDRVHPKPKLDSFKDPEGAAKTLASLRDGPSNVHVAPRTRKLYAKLEPELMHWCGRVADPDAALNRFVRFVDGYGIRGLLFETLLANPKLLELLIRLFDASAIFSDVVIRRPQLIEEIARGKALGTALTKQQFLDGLKRHDEDLPPLDWVRVYRRGEVLRILLRDILAFGSNEELQLEMTELAEACLAYCAAHLEKGNELTILALGKFGGRELLYGADLDVVFLGGEINAGERLIHAMTAKTGEGSVFPVDARLRPEGANGVLVIPLSAYRDYFDRRAQFWEMQALTKARALIGPDLEPLRDAVTTIWMQASETPDLKQQIYKMYHRITKERVKGDDVTHFKTGKGGLIGIEFLVQYFQMKSRIMETNTVHAIDRIDSLIDAPERNVLTSAYMLLRRIESVLRRYTNSSVSQLPSRKEELHALAVRLDFADENAFLEVYNSKRKQTQEIIEGHLS
jgi:[glutamine synthetase] adenylyltransferase / [glutamine synthetase]-adenylyl-L-tyrosine phosphorylase